MNVAAIIQARRGSTRLPDKVFLDLEGKPLIWHVFNRIKDSKFITQYILATTVEEKDNELEKWAIENNILVYRGSENDVLDRYYQAAKKFEADIVVRITADDPLKDLTVLDSVINELLIDVYNDAMWRLEEDETLPIEYDDIDDEISIM